jgi:hypothetical protein
MTWNYGIVILRALVSVFLYAVEFMLGFLGEPVDLNNKERKILNGGRT